MFMPSSMRDWLRLPSRIALLLGVGALSVAAARAEAADEARSSDESLRLPQQSAKALADLTIWKEDGRIYVSEAGKPAEELRLGNTAEAELLGRLLEGTTAATPHALRDRIILVGGGGCGFDLTPPQSTAAAGTSGNVARGPRSSIQSQTAQPDQSGVTGTTVAPSGASTKPSRKPASS
jgi:hypothetical protein